MSIEMLLPSIVGGAVGFVLAQAANLVKLIYWLQVKPKLVIGECEALEQEPFPDEDGDRVDYTKYRFAITNRGSRLSHNVKARITKIEIKNKGKYSRYPTNIEQLPWYGIKGNSIDLPPGSDVYVSLASYAYNMDVVLADAGHTPEFWEYIDLVEGDASRYTVVATDDDGSLARRVFTIPRPS